MKLVRLLLFPFSLVMVAITEFRHFLFYCGILKQKKFDLPVIVVGNLSAGGTGKSPMIDYLLKLLSPQFQPASLSRGYGRKSTGFFEVNKASKTQTVGDEPLMLLFLNPNSGIFVNENRAEGIEKIISNHPGSNIILLDDAFQHRYVKPGMAILLTTWDNPFYSDFLLPAGNLREMRKNANRAQIIIVTKCPELNQSQIDESITRIKKYSDAKVFFSNLKYDRPIALNGTSVFPSQISEVLLVTGIANANSLYNQCKSMYSSVNHIVFGDHHSYKTEDFSAIAKNFNSFATEEKVVLTTHKDAVKWLEADKQSLEIIKNLPIFYQPIQMCILNNENEFNELILSYVRSAQPNS